MIVIIYLYSLFFQVSGVAPWETGTARKNSPEAYDQSVVRDFFSCIIQKKTF